MQFYVYFWLRYDGTPYYVGKGKWKKRQQRAFREGCPSVDRIIIQDYESESEAFAAEKFFIDYFGRKDLGTGCLRNLTDGGEGVSGCIRSESVCRAISLAKFGIPRSDETKKKMSEAMKGHIIPAAQRAEHSKKMSGEGNPMFGKKRVFTPEWLAKQSLARIGKKHTEETKAKMRLNATGRKKSEETKRKISESRIKMFQKKKLAT